MKIKESKCEYEIDLPRCGADAHFQYYDKKQKKKIRADWLDNTGLPTTHFTGLFFAPCGSGKSSLVCSLLTSTKPKSRAYCGVFDKIYFCCPISSLRSMKDDPYESIPDNQIYEEFDDRFMNDMNELTLKNSEAGLDSCIVIDDACNKLKRHENALANLMLTHRHRATTILVLNQDVCQCPLSIRSNATCCWFFAQSNQKRMELLRTEFMSFMTLDEYKKFYNWCFKKKGDNLFIKFALPYTYYRNFKKLEFEGLENSVAPQAEERP